MIESLIQEGIDQKLFSTCVVGIVFKNGKRIVVPESKTDLIFDMASITKILPTTSLALQAMDEGKLHLNDKVIKFIPQLNNQYKDKITIRHLLTQTLSYGFRLFDQKDKSPDEILEYIFNAPLACPPGEKLFKSNIVNILLGIIVERIYGETLDVLLEKRFTTPLEMTRTGFNPLNRFPKNEIVPSQEDFYWRKRQIQGEIHDETSFTLNKKMVTGAAGLFSTAPDILNFIEMLLNKGQLDGRTYFSEKIIKNMQSGLGFDVGSRQQIGSSPSATTLSKTGFTGSIIIADIENGVGFAILTNFIFSHTKKDTTLNTQKMINTYAVLNEFRKKIIDSTYQCL